MARPVRCAYAAEVAIDAGFAADLVASGLCASYSEQANAPGGLFGMDDLSAGGIDGIDGILRRVRAALGEEARPGQAEAPVRTRARHSPSAIPLIQPADQVDGLDPAQRVYRIEDFGGFDEETFLRQAYRIVLGREIDEVGRSYNLPALRAGHISRVRVLGALRRSAEGREHGVTIKWLLPATVLDRLAGLPGVGRFFAPLMPLLVKPATDRRLADLAVKHLELIAAVNASLTAVRKSLVEFETRLDEANREAAAARVQSKLAMDRSQAAIDQAQAAEASASRDAADARAGRRLLAEEARQLRTLSDALRAGPAGLERAKSALDSLDDHALDSLYLGFENRFRGPTEEIARRAQRYLPIFTQNAAVAAGGVVLDIGCGRGEWLTQLTRAGVGARGVDLNVAMVEEAQGLGHDVVAGDAIAYLEGLPEGSLGAVTGFHIVEHLSFPQLVRLFDGALRALMPGGAVMFETPNPENLVVGACTFHYDPTHNKPLPPDLLRFVAEARGYQAVRVIRADADCDLGQAESGFVPSDVNDWFRQPPDYALYAQKPDPADRLA
ncbi:class I SAM-dependent methyltransferase [Alsobacter sp. KACC 23698]|uniref:Class I SAM-dependent methyltransferase n=1 Tax=Alsobacter sp. KACC 23698 TaxID=3149229 RepID=A0AAU7JJN5_9HYPH